MIRATSVRAKDSWTAAAADSVVLDFDDRHRRRIAMTGVRGLAFLLDLPDATMLRGGDALVLDDGRLVEVVASPEPLVEVRGRTPLALTRLAWHIGNRHLPAQILANAIRLRRDHVIEEMLRGLGAKVVEIDAPFDPEGGAYAQAPHGPGQHDHDLHGHDHHAHGHDDHARGGHGHAGHKHVEPDPHGHEHHGHDHGSEPSGHRPT